VNPKPFNVAIAGFGRIADTHLEAWNSLENTRVTAVVDDSPLARERARSLGMEAYEDMAQMLESGNKPNAISICSPPVFHLSQTLAMMSEGVAVLCEKPVSVDLDNAQRLVEGALQHRVPFQLATKFRHVPEIRKARDLVRHGVIGDPVTFHVEFAGSVDMSSRWNSVPQFSGGGVLIDNGCHAVDTIRFLLSGIVAAARSRRFGNDAGHHRVRHHRPDHDELVGEELERHLHLDSRHSRHDRNRLEAELVACRWRGAGADRFRIFEGECAQTNDGNVPRPLPWRRRNVDHPR
jgi:predicted dehydrogenase